MSEQKVKKGREAQPPAPEGVVRYVTAQKSNVIFDVQLRGEKYIGQWDGENVFFDIPAKHKDVFDASHHVASGLLVEQGKEAEVKPEQ
jgi:hypothetical protein